MKKPLFFLPLIPFGFNKWIGCMCLCCIFTTTSFSQNIAFKRANLLGKGMNISWLEQYWRGSEQKKQMDYLDYSLLARRKNDLQRMSVGVKTVRLPICFDRWEDRIPPFTIDSMNYFKVIDSMIQ